MLVDRDLRGQTLGLKAASKAERHIRAKQDGGHVFSADRRFENLFKKLGYEKMEEMPPNCVILKKSGKHQPKDDLAEHHRIEAVDPKTGKAKIFTFPIKKQD